MSPGGYVQGRPLLLTGVIVTISGVIALAGSGTHNQPLPQDPNYVSPAYATMAPSDVDFAKQVVGWTRPPKRIIVTNTGGKALSIDSVATGGDNSSEFTIVKDTCTGADVPPNRTCVIDVSFSPLRPEDRRANVTLTGSAINSPQTVRLKGTGINSSAVPPF